MTRYLALDRIKPGDIVLSAGLTRTSIGIRLATFSRVSHVAVALHPMLWFETLARKGALYKIVEPELVWDGKNVRLAMKIPRGECYFIKRLKVAPYCDDDPIARHTFARSLMQATSSFAFLNYATPDKFLPMLKFRLGRTRLARFIVRHLERPYSGLFPGHFCSWLVTELYNGLGLTLFDVNADRITPGAIDRSEKLYSVDSRIKAFTLAIPPHLESFECQLRLAVVMARENLSTSFTNASVAKSMAVLNEHITALKRVGGNRLREVASDEAVDALGELGEGSKEDFALCQSDTMESLGLAYAHLATSSELAHLLTVCQQDCSNQRQGGRSCAHLSGCHKLTEGFLKSTDDLYKVFPPPNCSFEAESH